MSRPKKEYYEYIVENPLKTVTLDEYEKSPATAFLKSVINAKNASLQCVKNFKGNIAAINSQQVINAGLLASIMGNLETFQKYLFAYMFEYSVYLDNFELGDFLRCLKVTVDVTRMSSFRDNPAAVGLVISDSLTRWHSPEDVNHIFHAFQLKNASGSMPDFYESAVVDDLKVLWQMRHSIVHTASTVTIPDSQKVAKLSSFGGKVIALEPLFIIEVARKLHPIIKKAVETQRDCYVNNVRPNIAPEIKSKIDRLFEVKSSVSIWLQ